MKAKHFLRVLRALSVFCDIAGLALVVYAVFRLSVTLGFGTLGVLLVLVSGYLERQSEKLR